MEAFLVLIFVAVLVYLFGSPLFLLIRLGRQREETARLAREIAVMQGDLERLRRRNREAAQAAEPTLEAGRAQEPDRPGEPGDRPWRDRGAEVSGGAADAPVSETVGDPAKIPAGGMAAADAPPMIPPADAPPPKDGGDRSSLEETLASRWMVWLGAVAVALSAVFLFRYAVDQGWLTPFTRVALGLVLGGALLAGGEWALRHRIEVMGRTLGPDYVPAALTGSGLFAIFVSVYAGHALFGLLTGAQAFVALGLVAYAALGLALRQGPFVGLVGLLAGYLVPALVDTPEPAAAPLFTYLFVLSAGCILVMVWRSWWWFSYLTIAGAMLWPVLWLGGAWSPGDQGVLGAYLLGLSVLFAAFSTRLPVKRPEDSLPRWLGSVLSDTSGIGFALSGVLLLVLADAAAFNPTAFAMIGLYGLASLVLALKRASLEGLLMISAAVVLVSLLVWPEPAEVTPAITASDLPRPEFGPFLVPPEYRAFAGALWSFAALYGIGFFAAMFRGRTPAVWSGVGTLVPLLAFAIGYWRMGDLEIDVSWAMVAAALAVLNAGAAVVTARARSLSQRDLCVAFYAAGATAALALAFTCLLREAWLTVALSCETLALAWIWSRVRLDEVRVVAAAVTTVVVVRLFANPEIFAYEGSVFGLFGWVVYGYGIPAVTTFLAARIFGRDGGGIVATMCEIAAAGFAFMAVALQLKIWTSGAILMAEWQLFDQSVQVLWWIAASALLLAEARRGARAWTYPAGLGLLAASVGALFLAHVAILSPLRTGEPVGGLPVVNLLGLAYLLPAAAIFAMGRSPRLMLPDAARDVLKGTAGVLLFVYLSLETRRAFQGTHIALTEATWPSDGEFYAYSAVWIVYALALLGIGILLASVPLRYASLAVLMVTVAKVFILDMADLTGLFRVASFLGLGLTLIGIGRAYQRFVFSAK